MIENQANETVEIRQSTLKMAGLALLALLMTAAAFSLAWPLFPVGYFVQFIGWIGVLFFGAAALAIIWRGATLHGPVVTVSPRGVRDIRVASQFVPWSQIGGLDIWQHGREKIVVVNVPEEVWQKLELTRIAKWSRGANTRLGADGLAISTQGLTIGTDELYEIMTAMRARQDGPAQVKAS